jgi:hypothetical protein
MITDHSSNAGYIPLQVMQSSGAVQTDGVQQDTLIQGLNPLLTILSKDITIKDDIQVNIRSKNGSYPHLVGYNHVIWKDGEPIDPFIFEIITGFKKGSDPNVILEREVYNKGKSLLEMTPLQRLMSNRWPTGFDQYSNIPEWVKTYLTETQRKLLDSPNFPSSYLKKRSQVLGAALNRELIHKSKYNQSLVDNIISYAERLRLVTFPKTTTSVWLQFLLHYGHTISGTMKVSEGDNPILKKIETLTNLTLDFDRKLQRLDPNSRWLIKYTKGVMDTDALSDLIYGELFIPIKVVSASNPIKLAQNWLFDSAIHLAVVNYTCKFMNPFWASYKVTENERITQLPSGLTIQELLQQQNSTYYTYAINGIDGISDFIGSFTCKIEDKKTKLTWQVSFRSKSPEQIVQASSLFGQFSTQINSALMTHFQPKTINHLYEP